MSTTPDIVGNTMVAPLAEKKPRKRAVGRPRNEEGDRFLLPARLTKKEERQALRHRRPNEAKSKLGRRLIQIALAALDGNRRDA